MKPKDDKNSFNDKTPEKLIKWISQGEKIDNLSAAEKAELQEWLSTSPENLKRFQELESTWNLMGKFKPASPSHENWEEIMANIELERDSEIEQNENSLDFHTIGKPSSQKFHQALFYAYRIAAVITVVFSIYFLQSYFNFDKLFEDNIALLEFTTANAQKANIKLTDGTIVHLNASSKLKYPKSFSKDVREVYLEGEAYFEVKHSDKTFIVQTPCAIIRDLGTEFNIKARGDKAQVVVKSGRVAIRSADTAFSEEIELQAGEMSEVKSGFSPTPACKVDLQRYLSWRKGLMIFELTPLADVLEELTRQYNSPFQLSDSNLAYLTLTGTFQHEHLEDILSDICLALELNYQKSKKGVLIYSNNQQGRIK